MGLSIFYITMVNISIISGLWVVNVANRLELFTFY